MKRQNDKPAATSDPSTLDRLTPGGGAATYTSIRQQLRATTSKQSQQVWLVESLCERLRRR